MTTIRVRRLVMTSALLLAAALSGCTSTSSTPVAPTTASSTHAAVEKTVSATTPAPAHTTAHSSTHTTTAPSQHTVKAAPPVVHTTTYAAAVSYANCTALNAVYPHGVGRPGAVDHVTSGKPVTTFFVSLSLYTANTGLDRDKDGIACEKH